MNTLSAYIVLGMMIMCIVMITIPVANVSSRVSDTSNLSGSSGWFFGNLGFVWLIAFVLMIFYWMNP